MIKVGEVYRHNKVGTLVEIKDITPVTVTVYLGYPKESCVNGRMIFQKDKEIFLQYFTKLTPLEMELL